MTQDKLNKAIEMCAEIDRQLARDILHTNAIHNITELNAKLKSLLQSDNYNTVLEEEINHCNTMLHNPPTEPCRMYYEGKKTGLEIAKSLL